MNRSVPSHRRRLQYPLRWPALDPLRFRQDKLNTSPPCLRDSTSLRKRQSLRRESVARDSSWRSLPIPSNQRGLRIGDRGSRIEDRGLKFQDRGSRIEVPGFRIENGRSRDKDRGSICSIIDLPFSICDPQSAIRNPQSKDCFCSSQEQTVTAATR